MISTSKRSSHWSASPRTGFFIAILAILLTAGSALPTAAQTTADKQPSFKQIKVASYNLQNFFDVFDDPYTGDEGTRPKSRDDLKAVADAIVDLDADVVGLIEIEAEGALKAMVYEMMPDAGYEYVAVCPTNSTRGINLGVLSRVPIVSLTSHRLQTLTLPTHPNKQWRFARDILQVRLQVQPGRVMDVFITHFKSKHDSAGDPESKNWRLAEAVAAKRMIDSAIAQQQAVYPDDEPWVLIMGDINDTPDSATVSALLNPAKGRTSFELVDVHKHLPADKRITYLRNPYRSTIDYVLTSTGLAKRTNAKMSGVPTDEAKLQASDHAPVYATFDLQ